MSRVTAERVSSGASIKKRRGFNRVPGTTYRLQFHSGFTLAQARELVSYLELLGVTDVYASPLFQAAPGSTHGYDICRPDEIGWQLGGEEAFQQFSSALREHGIGLLLDVVPNHMATHATNSWWWDVLKHGIRSRFAHFFEIDWHNPRATALKGRILLPVLGAPLDQIIDRNELKLHYEDGEWMVTYHDARFPVTPATPREFFDSMEKNGNPTAKRDAMIEILNSQHYSLAYWRTGLKEINYRRFFDVASLIALRMEEKEVFHATHRKVFEWVAAGQVTGLRVDHPDGLRDPRQYFERLQEEFAKSDRGRKRLYVVAEKILTGPETLRANWPIAGTTGYDFLNQVNGLFVDTDNEHAMTKVYCEFVGRSEGFREVAYRSKKLVLNQLFGAEVNALTREAHELFKTKPSSLSLSFEDLRLAILELIACFPNYRSYIREDSRKPESHDIRAIGEAHREALGRAKHLENAIAFVVSLLMLRMTLPKDAREFVLKFQQLTGPVTAKGIEDTALYNYHRLVSLNEVGGEPDRFGITTQEFHRANCRRAKHWPHSFNTTTTHDTKRGEDVRARINVLSEIPDAWRAAVLRWRTFNEGYKTVVRGEAAPDRDDEYLFYQTLVGTWPVELSLPLDCASPLGERMDEQQLSAFRARILEFMLKAIRESKRHTSWIEPDPAYEQATMRFVERVLASTRSEFLADFTVFNRSMAFFGAINSLSQLLLKLTSPGVPDLYQGSELLDLSLVDPDNRRPVDFEERRRLLEGFKRRGEHDTKSVLEPSDLMSGKAKMLLLWKVLEFRRARRDLFNFGDYTPLRTMGPYSRHVCAFARTWCDDSMVVVCPRLNWQLNRGNLTSSSGSRVWLEQLLELPSASAGTFRNVLTGENLAMGAASRLPIAEVLRTFPVALLTTS